MTGTAPSGGGGAPAAPIDWASLINELGALGQLAAKDFTDSAAKSAEAARHGTYGADEWLQDVELFWDNLAEVRQGRHRGLSDQLPKS